MTAAIAMWNTSRDPTHVTRLILLFTLAIALGVLSTGLNATLSFSEVERARHSTGGEARLSFDDFIPLSTLDSFHQINTTSAVWRGSGRANVRSYRNIPSFSILAIEPMSFATVSQFRIDYSDDYIGYVLGQLMVNPEQLPVSAIPLPEKPTNIGIWIADPFPARTDVNILDYVDVRTKLQTSEGEITILDLDHFPDQISSDGQTSPSFEFDTTPMKWFQFLSLIYYQSGNSIGEDPKIIPQEPTWRYFEAPVPDYAEPGYPLSLHSIWIKIRPLPTDSENQSYSPGRLIIDDLSYRDSDQNLVSFEGFERAEYNMANRGQPICC